VLISVLWVDIGSKHVVGRCFVVFLLVKVLPIGKNIRGNVIRTLFT
jgi:hypothetical protein